MFRPSSPRYLAALAVVTATVIHAAPAPAGLLERSDAWARIQHGEYLVENNTWNIAAARPGRWRQSVFCDPASGSLGWRWDFTGENDVLKTYPEIIYGKKPYDGYASTTPRLPAPLAAARFRLEYDYAAKATGTYNTTTDITFTDSAAAGEVNIRAKLMIWFDRQNLPFFAGQVTTRALIAGRQHQVFIDRAHAAADGKWIFIALLPEGLPNRGELNLTEYFAYLMADGTLKPEWFLSSIEAGSEIASGTGEAVFKRFIVH